MKQPRIPIEELRKLPQDPRPIGRQANWTLLLRSVAEYVAEAPPLLARIKSFVDPYPSPFRRVRFGSRDGTRLRGWIGIQKEDRKTAHRPGLLIVPGLFSSKDLLIQRARAVKVFRDWGFHVMVMDLRGFGDSGRSLPTAGWKESEDVAAAVAAFRARAAPSAIHLYAESLGATAALIAASQARRSGGRLIDGRLIAVSPYADASRVVRHLSRKRSLGVEYFMIQWFLSQLLRLGGSDKRTLAAYIKDAATAYRVSPKTLLARSSPKARLGAVNVPTLILLSRDDPVVPRRELAEFERRLRGRRNPCLWILPWGSHCLYEMADPDWFWAVLRRVCSGQ